MIQQALKLFANLCVIVINDDNRELDAKELLQIPEAAVAFVNSQNKLVLVSCLGNWRHRHKTANGLDADQWRPAASETIANLFATSRLGTVATK
jgi:hypothetical protein